MPKRCRRQPGNRETPLPGTVRTATIEEHRVDRDTSKVAHTEDEQAQRDTDLYRSQPHPTERPHHLIQRHDKATQLLPEHRHRQRRRPQPVIRKHHQRRRRHPGQPSTGNTKETRKRDRRRARTVTGLAADTHYLPPDTHTTVRDDDPRGRKDTGECRTRAALNTEKMKPSHRLLLTLIVSAASVAVTTPARAADTNETTDAEEQSPSANTEPAWAKVVVDLSEQRLVIRDNAGNVVRTWKVSTGGDTTPTPTGRYRVTSKSLRTHAVDNPRVTMNHMVRFRGGVGFHGIPRLDGKPLDTPLGERGVSHGCVRLADRNARELYRRLPVGATVVVKP